MALIAVFITAGVPLVFFSCGYRFSLSTLKITKSGGLYVRSVPPDAKIYVDRKPVTNSSSILSSGTLINGLTPGKYELKVTKDGYYAFLAEAEIIPLQASSFGGLVLAPTVYNSYLTGDISDFYIQGSETIVEDSAGKLRYKNQVIPGEQFGFFTADGKSVVTSVSGDGERIYLLISLSNPRASTNINEVFWSLKSSKLGFIGEVPVQAIAPHPYDPDKLLVSTAARLYAVDIKNMAITIMGNGAEKILPGNPSVILLSNNSLINYNLTLKTRTPIMGVENARIISVSPNGRKIATLWENKTLEIYDATDKKSLRFNLSGLNDIKDIFWHKGGNYLFVLADNNVYFVYAEKEGINPQIIYEGAEKAVYSDGGLYVLSQGEIKTSKF
ncbi:MAG: PEGA domain-containing protein [Parcubacteria group bacterium]